MPPDDRSQSPAHASRRRRLHPPAAKVPEITLLFSGLKLLTTAMGEAMSDFLGQRSVPAADAIGILGIALAFRIQCASTIALVVFVGLVAYAAITRRDVQQSETHRHARTRGAGLEPGPRRPRAGRELTRSAKRATPESCRTVCQPAPEGRDLDATRSGPGRAGPGPRHDGAQRDQHRVVQEGPQQVKSLPTPRLGAPRSEPAR